jgi:membrane dipeptidase
MMRALAKNGGVIMINYEVSFLSEENRLAGEKSGGVVAALDKMSKTCGGDEACSTLETARITREAMDKGTVPAVSWEKIVEHIDHAVKVAGVDHVGLGSDFDGATMPIGMEDASQLPKLTTALMTKGYTAADVEKILGGNILRVMEQVEQGAGRASRYAMIGPQMKRRRGADRHLRSAADDADDRWVERSATRRKQSDLCESFICGCLDLRHQVRVRWIVSRTRTLSETAAPA